MTDITAIQVRHAVVSAILDAAGERNRNPSEATVNQWLDKRLSDVLNSTSGDVEDSALVIAKRTDERLWVAFPPLSRLQLADETWLTEFLQEKVITYADKVEAKVREELEQKLGG